MTGPIVDVGRSLVVFASSQAAFDAISGAGEDYPEAADAIRVISANVGGASPTAMREDRFGTATRVGGILQKRTAEASLEAYLMTSGTVGTAPDIDELLTSSGWSKAAGAGSDTTASGGTTSRITVAATTGWAVGDCGIFENGSGTGGYELRRITAVDTGGTNLDVSPALENSPVSGANVKAGVLYSPSDTRDNSEDCLTIFAANNNSLDRAAGWTPDSLSVTLGSDEAAKISLSGTARQHDRLVQTYLASSVTDIATTATVTNGDAGGEEMVNTYWQIEDEVVKVTAVSGATWTIVRAQLSTSGATHAQDIALTPYTPTGTYAGSPLPATSGAALVVKDGGSTPVSLQVSSATLTAGFGVEFREDVHGDAYKARGYVMTPREVEVSLSGWALRGSSSSGTQTDKLIDVLQDALDADTQLVFVQQGEASGSMVAFEAPTVRVQTPSMDRGAEEVTVELAGPAEGTVSGGDEVYLMFG